MVAVSSAFSLILAVMLEKAADGTALERIWHMFSECEVGGTSGQVWGGTYTKRRCGVTHKYLPCGVTHKCLTIYRSDSYLSLSGR